MLHAANDFLSEDLNAPFGAYIATQCLARRSSLQSKLPIP
ncbi:hypothetical protein BBTM_00198 [Bifidobacterium bifidum]|nr:hypothetical protein BBTM_00198 [Bifidobacterium bifidum]